MIDSCVGVSNHTLRYDTGSPAPLTPISRSFPNRFFFNGFDWVRASLQHYRTDRGVCMSVGECVIRYKWGTDVAAVVVVVMVGGARESTERRAVWMVPLSSCTDTQPDATCVFVALSQLLSRLFPPAISETQSLLPLKSFLFYISFLPSGLPRPEDGLCYEKEMII